jgi:hypothetical protein
LQLPSWGGYWVEDDYHRCLKHEVGVFDDIPEKLMEHIQGFAENSFTPAVLTYLKVDPKHHARLVKYVQQEGFVCHPDDFTKELEYDLSQTDPLVYNPPWISSKIDGKRAVGSAIRVCKAIKRPDLANEFYNLVHECFIPDEHQDPTDYTRGLFGLPVEPSKGGIQCNCCQGE